MNLLQDSPWQSVEHATVWLLIVFSVVTWGLALVKLTQFSRLARLDRRFKEAFWKAANLPDAIRLSDELPGALARQAQAGFNAIRVEGPEHSLASLRENINHEDRLERSLRQQTQRERRQLESGLAVLGSIGSTSPFIGLFGTVWGIMEALKSISASGSANLEAVAGPIGAALIATGVGIAVAVPAVLIYNYFVRRLKLVVGDLDDFAHDFFALLQKTAYRVIPEPGAERPTFELIAVQGVAS